MRYLVTGIRAQQFDSLGDESSSENKTTFGRLDESNKREGQTRNCLNWLCFIATDRNEKLGRMSPFEIHLSYSDTPLVHFNGIFFSPFAHVCYYHSLSFKCTACPHSLKGGLKGQGLLPYEMKCATEEVWGE